MERLFNNYEAKLSGQMVKSLGCSIINMYSMGACAVLGITKLNKEEVERLFNNYEAKLSGQMVKSLGCSIINMYSMGACAALGITNQNALSEDLENDPFLKSALQRLLVNCITDSDCS